LVEGDALFILGYVSASQGDHDRAKAYFQQGLNIAREMGDRHNEGHTLDGLGLVCCDLGQSDRARVYLEEGLRIHRATGHRRGECVALVALGMLSYGLGDIEAARDYCQQAACISRVSADRSVQALALSILGHALTDLGRLSEATNAYRQALTLHRQLSKHHVASVPLAGQARVCLVQGDVAQAQAHVEEILDYLEHGQMVIVWGMGEAFRVYLTCYRVLEANADPRAQDLLEEAHGLLQERAAKISDEGERRSYLENVAANREIVSEYARLTVSEI
jgi:tetratricopeptide (TPR) repeat protein